MYLLLVFGAGLIVGYEVWAAVTDNVTISQMVWSLPASATFFMGLGIGVLLGHLFVPRRIAR